MEDASAFTCVEELSNCENEASVDEKFSSEADASVNEPSGLVDESVVDDEIEADTDFGELEIVFDDKGVVSEIILDMAKLEDNVGEHIVSLQGLSNL